MTDPTDDDELVFPEFPPSLLGTLDNVNHLAIDLKYRDDTDALHDVPGGVLSLRLDGRRNWLEDQLTGEYFRCLVGLEELHLRDGMGFEDELDHMCEARGIHVQEFEFQPSDTHAATALWLDSIESFQ